MSISSILTARWKTGRHVGIARPTQTVEVQRGVMDKSFQRYEHLDGTSPDFGYIDGSKHNAKPWQGEWRSTGDWMTLPNVSEVQLEETFDENGLGEPEVATITIENVVAEQINGLSGIFRRIRRGFMAPWRGFTPLKRVPDKQAIPNEWFDVLNGGYRIKVTQGYGDAQATTFIGLIDDCDTRSLPDQITVTARNFGCLLTDQRVFGWNKARDITSPVVFADRLGATKTEKVGSNADASSTDPAHSYQNVLRTGNRTYWLSDGHATPDVTEWVEVHLPKGRYNEFYVAPEYDGMEMFVSVYLKGTGNKIDGAAHGTGWVDTGTGSVPGAHGGFPYVKHWGTVSDSGVTRKLPFTLDCDDGCALRVSFRRLGFSSGKGDYRAKVSRLLALREKIDTATLKTRHWIMVDDAADVVKWMLMWAGFHEWEVEPLGVRLKTPITFHQGDYMIDVISHILQQANYTFFIDRPSDNPDSIGVPRFVKNKSMVTPRHQEEVRDTDLLTGIETKFTKEPLAFAIRVRGKELAASKGGVKLGEDLTTRVQALYFPPWSGAHHSVVTGEYDPSNIFAQAGRTGGIRKHVVHWDEGVETYDEAIMGCVLIAIQEALAAFQATLQIPGYPGLRLNESVSVKDTSTGVNSRLWIGSRNSVMTTGPEGAWTMTVAGALADTPDMLALAADYLILLKAVQSEGALPS